MRALHIIEIVIVVLAVVFVLVSHPKNIVYDEPEIVTVDVNDIVEDVGEVRWDVEAQQSMSEQILHMAKEK